MVEKNDICRHKYDNEHRVLLQIHDVDDNQVVHMATKGGGMVKKIPLNEFDTYFTIVTPEKLEELKTQFEPAMFTIGDNATYDDAIPGFTNGDLWNGWAMPMFRKEDIEEHIKRTESDYWKTIIFEEGALNISSNNAIPSERPWDDLKALAIKDENLYEVELSDGLVVTAEWFPAQVIMVGDDEVTAYPVGAGSWTWETAEAPSFKP